MNVDDSQLDHADYKEEEIEEKATKLSHKIAPHFVVSKTGRDKFVEPILDVPIVNKGNKKHPLAFSSHANPKTNVHEI